MKGQVYRSTGSWYDVKGEDGITYQSRLRGKFKQEGIKVNNPIAVGDFVEVIPDEQHENSGLITEIQNRENYIIRKSTRKNGFSHILAANVDQALLLATVSFPRTSQGFIDRFLVSAESFRIPALVIFNKKDLLNEKELDKTLDLCAMYDHIGYETDLISAQTEEGLETIKKHLKGKTTLIAGHSGVGKSTLLNKLIPGLAQKTGEVSTFANKGTHTTTFAEMFEVDAETKIIDTPGIKELGLVDMEASEISHYFPEMRQYIGECRFNNCLHVNEPGCKVIEALEEGEIFEERYMSYLSMLQDYDSHR
ncbi:MAG: ribosome small subunit-dependent GTPase A [Roseivirga sp.]|uniref:ribosome small subunit-dependent GTPase A n=1 Tax=Roseivirga sp. TaxID=1964215 RepID=UPI001B10DE3F|nr:ribosome small subunit-dependent GTPase A [Roseivirga sp.]MBO6662254.1 ribosome small subunit-dependent GTPase A [Roseivirga sp.]MBO6759434.1 ribosome small subunit-dependent GTPase A [Roseivirga sp.]MBO6910240.1 ribosome small subunit-dependent GTPase A [Roseivirga sp.]